MKWNRDTVVGMIVAYHRSIGIPKVPRKRASRLLRIARDYASLSVRFVRAALALGSRAVPEIPRLVRDSREVVDEDERAFRRPETRRARRAPRDEREEFREDRIGEEFQKQRRRSNPSKHKRRLDDDARQKLRRDEPSREETGDGRRDVTRATQRRRYHLARTRATTPRLFARVRDWTPSRIRRAARRRSAARQSVGHGRCSGAERKGPEM